LADLQKRLQIQPFLSASIRVRSLTAKRLSGYPLGYRQSNGVSSPADRTGHTDAKPKEKPYKLFDERGLFLLIKPSDVRLWRLKYQHAGREKLISLGAYPDVSLKRAREKRDEARKLIADRVDPSALRKAEKLARSDTLAAIAEEWLAARKKVLAPATLAKAEWRLRDLLMPYIGNRPIREINAPDVLSALRRIEARGKHETTHRVKQRAGQVFRYAVATGRADRDPTTDLRGALVPVVVRNHPAITEPKRIGQLLRAIDGYDGQPVTQFALKLAPLVFVRVGELRKAQWHEFDLEAAEWRIPAERMKMREPHLVPLARQAVELLRELQPITGPDGLLFPSLRSAVRPMSESTIGAALRRLGYSKDEMTSHGFRAMARRA
jgi:integrase